MLQVFSFLSNNLIENVYFISPVQLKVMNAGSLQLLHRAVALEGAVCCESRLNCVAWAHISFLSPIPQMEQGV